MIGRIVVLAVAALALTFVAAPPVSAQPADAVGKPLPDASMRDGTVMVRVVAGDRNLPVTGTEVTLTMTPASGTGAPTTQVARTDAEGRATFTDVPEAIRVKLTTVGTDGTTIVGSQQFPMPQTGGIRVMLSTVPLAGTAPGAQGPMTPRMMSGQPRPEAGDARDTITVRISYDDFSDAAPLDGVPIALVGYRHDQTVVGRVATTDAAGRAVFAGSDPRGATSYFAMTQLPRNGATDRLASIPILLDGEAGVRVMLSSEQRTSTAAPVDDFARLEDQPTKATIPRGVVRVLLSGVPELGHPVELIDALTGEVLKTTPAERPLLELDSAVTTWTDPVADPALATGTLAVTVKSGGRPLVGVTVGARRTDGVADLATATQLTDATGTATLTGLPPGVAVELSLVADLDVTFKQMVTVPAQGGARVAAEGAWQVRGDGGCRFIDVAAGAERAYAVRTTMRGQRYLSAPFQLTPERGVSITVLVYPRVMFSFSLTSWIDDVYVGVRGQFAIRNTSWAPYVASTDGRPDELTMPLPEGFTGAMVRDDFQDMVGIDPARGFIIRRPIPPGGYQFIAGFSLPVEDGELRWSMPLPLGAFESGIEIKHPDGNELRVVLPPVRGPKVEQVDDERGRFSVISPITIMPGERMVFALEDLPREPAWRRWSRVAVGLAVLAIIVLCLVFALWRPRDGAVPEAQFEALLDELAALEASGAEPARRAALMTQLEALYRQAPHRRAEPGPG